ncbi:MAG: hypothetical protein PHX43_00510 [Alphaproteobacteria bacterium]|nr:hypothetical protein [Alphaproteobacteria bacterium]
MNKNEQLRLCLMLAFQSMISQGENVETSAVTQRIVQLAQLMNEFCDMHLAQTFPEETINLVDDKGAAKIDAAINLHIEELQKRESTQLPADRETLIQFYDRLQQRKTRRSQWLFYAQAPAEELADLVLQYMDEEIEEKNAGGYQ